MGDVHRESSLCISSRKCRCCWETDTLATREIGALVWLPNVLRYTLGTPCLLTTHIAAHTVLQRREEDEESYDCNPVECSI